MNRPNSNKGANNRQEKRMKESAKFFLCGNA